MTLRRQREKIIKDLKNQGMKNPNQFDVINNQQGGKKMKESIVKMQRGPFPKKYTAVVRNKKTKKTRKIHFGDRRYQQYKDRTKLKLYKKKIMALDVECKIILAVILELKNAVKLSKKNVENQKGFTMQKY